MAWMLQWNIHMSCTHVHTHVAKRQASTVWLLCAWSSGRGLGGLVVALLFFCGSRRRISWRRLELLVLKTWQSPASLPRSSTALTGGDRYWRGAPEFPLKLSRALTACPGSSVGEVGRSQFCLVVAWCPRSFFFVLASQGSKKEKTKAQQSNRMVVA